MAFHKNFLITEEEYKRLLKNYNISKKVSSKLLDSLMYKIFPEEYLYELCDITKSEIVVNYIFQYQVVSEKFIEDNRKGSMIYASMYQKLSPEFIKKYINRLNHLIFAGQDLSEDLIFELYHYFVKNNESMKSRYKDYILRNQILSDESIKKLFGNSKPLYNTSYSLNSTIEKKTKFIKEFGYCYKYFDDYFIAYIDTNSINNLKFNIELGNNVVSNLPTKFSFLSLNQITTIKRNYSMLENNNRFVLVKIKYEDLTRLRVANKIELVTWVNDRLKFSS